MRLSSHDKLSKAALTAGKEQRGGGCPLDEVEAGPVLCTPDVSLRRVERLP